MTGTHTARFALVCLAILTGAAVTGAAVTGAARADEPPAARDTLAKLQGQWVCDSMEQDGKPLPRRAYRERRLFFGGNRFLIRDGVEVVQAGTGALDADAPAGLDLAIAAGAMRGVTMLGLFELKGDVLRLCLDTAGRERPTEYKTSPDSGLIMAVYKREKSPEEPDIAGLYDCEGVEMDGNRYTARVEIRRVGDAYTVAWTKGATPMHLGIGLRKGGALAVSFANPGMAGIAVYQIGKDKKLVGEWTELGGLGVLRTETLTPRAAADRGK